MSKSVKEYFFRFKEFGLRHADTAMKVGTDSLLLGAWAPLCGTEKQLLDIGSGCGILSLMMAQRSKNVRITGVEIDEPAANESLINIAESPWNDRIVIVQKDIRDFSPGYRFDHIVTNPPFFHHLAPVNVQRFRARHQSALSRTDLFKVVDRLLSEDGFFSMIIPADQSQLCLEAARSVRLYPDRQTFIHHRKDLPSKRILLCFSRKEKITDSDTLVIDDLGARSAAYQDMMRPFLLDQMNPVR